MEYIQISRELLDALGNLLETCRGIEPDSREDDKALTHAVCNVDNALQRLEAQRIAGLIEDNGPYIKTGV